MARPTKFRDEYVDQAYNYALLGATDEQLATFFDVDVATIYRWKNQQPAFCEALRKGKAVADATVARSLYRRANGYDQPGEKLISVPQGDGVSVVERHDIVQHIPADVTACIFWLKNRQPEQWREKTVQQHELPEGTGFVVNMRSSLPQEPDDGAA